MEGAKQNGKTPKTTCGSHLSALQPDLPKFISAMAIAREQEMKRSGGGGGGCGCGAEAWQELDAAIALRCLRGPKGIGGLFGPQSDVPSASSDGLAENVASASLTKKRRRDGVTPLAATVSPPSFTAQTSGRHEDSSNHTTANAATTTKTTSSPPSAFLGNRSRSKRALAETQPRSLPEALMSCSGRDDETIPDGLLADIKRMGILQFQQQYGVGLPVSLERSEDSVDDQAGSNYRTSPLSTIIDSSFLNDTGFLMGEIPMNYEEQLSAVMKLVSTMKGAHSSNDDSMMVQFPQAVLESAAQSSNPSVILELLQYKGSEEGGLDGGDGSSRNLYADESMGDDDDDDFQEDEDRSFHSEYLDDLKETIEKVSLLSLPTLKEITVRWGIQPEGDEEENESYYRRTIAGQLRLLALTICDDVSKTFDTQGPTPFYSSVNERLQSNDTYNNTNTKSNSSSGGGGAGGLKSKKSQSGMTDETMNKETDHDGGMCALPSLRRAICTLSGEQLRNFANKFGFLDRRCSGEEIFMTISALGALTFFSPLPTSLLEKVCQELSISITDENVKSFDTHYLHEILVERVTHHFYPLSHSGPSITKLPFMPQMKIHEHAPGRYTCTVDNAKFIRVMMLQRLVSNRFSCNKIRWHALLTVVNDELSFYVWHRETVPLTAHMVVRTQNPKKKKNNTTNGTNNDNNINTNNNNNNNNNASQNQESTLKESSALFLEREVEGAPGELIGFENFVTLTVALTSSTMSQSGYRIYNRAEDRLVFQYAMDLVHPDGTTLVDEGRKKSSSNHQAGNNGTVSRGSDESTQNGASDPQQTNASLLDEKRRKEWKQAVSKLEKNETQQRDALKQAWSNAHRQLLNEHAKAYQKALQRKKDRERKILLAKVGPSPEMQRELETLTQTVAAHRAQVTKLAKEKAKEEAAIKRLKEQIDEGNLEVARLQQQLRSSTELLSELESETAACIARTKKREETKRRKQRAFAAALRIPELTATRHETLAINDLQSFWDPSCTNGTASFLVASSVSPTHSSSQCSPQLLAAATPGVGSSNNNNTNNNNNDNNNASFPAVAQSIPLPRSSVTSRNSGGVYFPNMQSATSGAMGVGLSTWAPLSDPLSFTTSVQAESSALTFEDPSNTTTSEAARHLAGGTDAIGGPVVGQGSGFIVTAPFNTTSAISRFTLDANARPFTPTSLVTGRSSANSAPLATGFTVKAGTAPVRLPSPHSPPPMAGIGGSPVAAVAVSPERPRYTAVSTPMSGGLAGGGLFSTDPMQGTAPLFAPPGPANTSGTLLQPSNKSLSLNFTTAPWN